MLRQVHTNWPMGFWLRTHSGISLLHPVYPDKTFPPPHCNKQQSWLPSHIRRTEGMRVRNQAPRSRNYKAAETLSRTYMRSSPNPAKGWRCWINSARDLKTWQNWGMGAALVLKEKRLKFIWDQLPRTGTKVGEKLSIPSRKRLGQTSSPGIYPPSKEESESG